MSTLSLTTLATLTQVAAQTSAIGREAHRMWRGADGLFYVAYGSYPDNTGPIRLLSIDPVTGAVVDHGTMATEETWAYRTAGAVTLVPYVDPQGGNESTAHYAVLSGGSWVVDQTVAPAFDAANPEHLMDAAITADGWWLAGSAYGANPSVGGAASVYLSTDLGASWALSLNLDGPDNTGFARVYLLVPVGDELLAFGDDTNGGRQFRRAAGVWTEEAPILNPPTDYVPFSHNGTAFAFAWRSGKPSGFVDAGAASVLTATADAAQRATIAATLPSAFFDVYDAKVTADGQHLYVLDNEFVLWRATTAGVWAQIGAVSDGTIRSMALDETDGRLLFTTTDSRVLTAPIPA